jgi:outer membrane protein assembly factor BamB
MPHSKIIYLGVKGSVIAMDPATGRQLWSVHLKGSDFVNVVLDGENLYATTHGEIFCLDPENGDGRWHDRLSGFGLGFVSIAGEGIASGQSLLQAAELARRQREAASAATSGASAH